MLGRKGKCLGVHHCANSRVRKAVTSDRNEHNATFRFGPSLRNSACQCGPPTGSVRVVPENRECKGGRTVASQTPVRQEVVPREQKLSFGGEIEIFRQPIKRSVVTLPPGEWWQELPTPSRKRTGCLVGKP